MKTIQYLTPKFLFVLCSLLGTQHSHTMWKEASENLKNNFEQLVFMASKGSFNLSPNQQYSIGVGIGLSGILLGSIKHRIDQYNSIIDKKVCDVLKTRAELAACKFEFEYAVRLKAKSMLEAQHSESGKVSDIHPENPDAITLAAKDYLESLKHLDTEDGWKHLSDFAKLNHVTDNMLKYKRFLNESNTDSLLNVQKRDPIFSYYANMKWYKKAWYGNSVKNWFIAPDYKKSPRILKYEEVANKPN